MKAQVTLEASTPILFNRMSEELLEELRTKVKTPRVRDITREDEAAPKLYTDGEGRIGVPMEMVLASLKHAGRQVVYSGRSKVSTATTTKLYGFFSIEGDELLLFEERSEWKPDVRRGRNPNGGEAVALCRPRIDRWKLVFDVWFDEGQVNLATIEQLFQIAGRSEGLADFRPNCGGNFGRFRITSLVEIDEAASNEADVSTNGHREVAAVG